MRSGVVSYGQVNLEYDWALKNGPYSGFKKDLLVICEVFEKFLKTEKGRYLLKKKNGSFLCIALTFCGPRRIQSINNKHRKKNAPTDVLSFPQFTDWSEAFLSPEIHLGDIVICFDICKKQAKEHKIPLREEFFHLVFHGFLHLLDYDHERSKQDETQMFALEDKLVNLALERKK